MTSCAHCGAQNGFEHQHCVNCGESLVDAATRHLIGTVVLGSYQIIDVIGQGGMSVVYKGQHKLTEQLVALKILPAELAVHAAIRARFLEEAKALARLEHPNIVRLYNFGEENGRFVLAMRYVAGATFEDRIFQAGRLKWQEACKITIDVLKALEYAHRQNIVHRDMKPSNILIDADGTAMLMDFGIAKMTAETSKLTATGQTMGTVRYMSPEQVRGESVEHYTDIYSLGVSLYEAVAGDTPFDGNTHFDIMSKHLSDPPPGLIERGIDIPQSLENVLMRSMEKEPPRRFESAAAFQAALENVLAGRSVADTRTRAIGGIANEVEEGFATGSGGRWLWVALALLVVGAAGVVFAVTRPGADNGSSEDVVAIDTGWPEVVLVKGIKIATDEKLADPHGVRVISPKPVDAQKIAKTVVAARNQFAEHVREAWKQEIESHPLNLVVAAEALMCDRMLWSGAVRENCASTRFRYPQQGTLYVLDSDELESVNIPEGAALHFCLTTKKLNEIGCSKILTPYFDQLESSHQKVEP